MPREDTYMAMVEAAANSNKRSAPDILRTAVNMLETRGEDYGPPSEHYHELADIQSAFFQKERTARDVALANVLEKLDRVQRTDSDSAAFKDSFIDALAYLAIAWECS